MVKDLSFRLTCRCLTTAVLPGLQEMIETFGVIEFLTARLIALALLARPPPLA